MSKEYRRHNHKGYRFSVLVMKYLYILLCITKPFLHLQSRLCVLFPYVYIAWLLYVLYTMYGLCKSRTFNVYVSHEFCLWPLFASPWVRVSCGGPRGTSPWARVAFGWALWLRTGFTGLLEPNLPQVTVRGCWAGSGAFRACWGVSRGSLSGVPWTRAVCCTCGHVYFFVFYYVSLYLYPESLLYMYVLLNLYPEVLL